MNYLLVQIQKETTEAEQSQTERVGINNDGGGNDGINKGTKNIAKYFCELISNCGLFILCKHVHQI